MQLSLIHLYLSLSAQQWKLRSIFAQQQQQNEIDVAHTKQQQAAS